MAGRAAVTLLAGHIAVAADGHGAAVDRELTGEGRLVDAEPVGHHRRDDRELGVGGGHAGEDQVVAFLLQGLGQHERGAQRARAVDRVIEDVDGLVATDGQGLAQAFGGLGWPDGEEDDLGGHSLLGELRGLLDGILVELGEASFDAGAVDGEVGSELPRGRGLGHVLDEDDDLHA
jgi:hypothetical protein